MKRLSDYFESASVCDFQQRKIGLEVETLFVDQSGQPISWQQSQDIFTELVKSGYWEVVQCINGTKVRLARKSPSISERFELYYELGWNNLEISTPPYNCNRLAELFAGIYQVFLDLEMVAKKIGVCALSGAYDFCSQADTLMFPDDRDRLWQLLDGDVLKVLSHIAAIHVNIDLCSLDEGFKLIKRFNSLYQSLDWPLMEVQDIWGQYINDSLAGYKSGRYGPSPATYKDYLHLLAGYRVVMNEVDGQLQRVVKPKSFTKTPNVDIDMFLRSVWWWNRLRVRNGQLVLEARGIPRLKNREIFSTLFFANLLSN